MMSMADPNVTGSARPTEHSIGDPGVLSYEETPLAIFGYSPVLITFVNFKIVYFPPIHILHLFQLLWIRHAFWDEINRQL